MDLARRFTQLEAQLYEKLVGHDQAIATIPSVRMLRLAGLFGLLPSPGDGESEARPAFGRCPIPEANSPVAKSRGIGFTAKL